MEIITVEDHSMNTQIVRNWMTTDPITITPQTTLPKVHRLIVDHHLHHLPVINVEDGKMVDIITETDVCLSLLYPETVN